MCSQQEDVIPDEEVCMKDPKICVSSQCKRCEKKADIVLRKKDSLCRSCFSVYITHKFRATLGKSRIMKPKDRVLIAYSGGQAAAAMLHFVTEGQNEIARKKVVLDPILLHIEEPNFGPVGSELNASSNMKMLMSSSKYPAYVVKLQQVLNKDFSVDMIHAVKENEDNTEKESVDAYKEQLQELINNVKTLSAQEDLLHRLKMKLLASCAKLLNCPKVFIGDTANKLAVRIVAGLALGRGGQMLSEMGFLDNRHADVTFIRPMREILSKEVSFYNVIKHIPFESCVELSTKTNLNSSIQRLTEGFVNGLQENFPATISTVFRTGDKIVTSTKENNALCVICKSEVEVYDSNKSSAMDALKLSSQLEQLYIKKNNSNDDTVDANCGGNCSCKGSNSQIEQLKMHLCYACRIVISDLKDPKFLPEAILSEASVLSNRMKMKEMIADYLIEDEDS